MTAVSAQRLSLDPRHHPLATSADNRCGLVDVLLGIRREGFFRFEADEADAVLLFAEVRRILSLQAQVLRMRGSERIHEIRLGRFPDEPMS